MRGWAKNSLVPIFLLAFIGLFPLVTAAGKFSAQIQAARLEPQDGWYVLSADMEHVLSPAAKEAIQSSIPLEWCLKVRLYQVGYFHNKTVAKMNYRYRIHYHALLNSYSVTNTTTQVQKKYASLTEALDALSRIRDLKVTPLSTLHKNQAYEAKIKLQFDTEQLPPPLRPLAYFHSDWNLSSTWYLWSLQKN